MDSKENTILIYEQKKTKEKKTKEKKTLKIPYGMHF